jgi:hypothetical protein
VFMDTNNRPHVDPLTQVLAQDIRQIKELLMRLTGRAETRDPSINGFCKRQGISRSLYIKLRRLGKGPQETAIGLRRTITVEAESAWEKARQDEAEGKRLARGGKPA